MTLEELSKKVIALGAPILGAAIAGPAGAKAANLIANYFHIDTDADAIDEKLNAEALREIESSNYVELQRLANQKEAAKLDYEFRVKDSEQKDRVDARAKTDPKTARNLTYILLIGLFMIMFGLFWDNNIPETAREPLAMLVGFFIGEVKHALNFQFGG